MAFLEYKNFKIVDLCLQGKTNGISLLKAEKSQKIRHSTVFVLRKSGDFLAKSEKDFGPKKWGKREH